MIELCLAIGIIALCSFSEASAASTCQNSLPVNAREVRSTILNCTSEQTLNRFANGTVCHVECKEQAYLYSAYVCSNGRWYADFAHGKLCSAYEDCSITSTSLICDRCEDPSQRDIRRLPHRCSASLKQIIVRCHSMSDFSIDCLFHAGTSLEYIDVSRNAIQFIYRSSFGTTRNLRFLNTSYNRMNKLDAVMLPPWRNLQVLDISHNPLTTIEPSTFSLVFPANCDINVTFVAQEIADCECNLSHRPPSCNSIMCDCQEQLNVSCDFIKGSSDAPSIPADHVCDGTIDCPDCSDERFCDGSFTLEAQELAVCMGDRVSVKLHRGVGLLAPANLAFEQSHCIFIAGTQFLTLPLMPITGTSPLQWSLPSRVSGVSFQLDYSFDTSDTLIASVSLQYPDGMSNLSERVVFPKECPLVIQAADPVLPTTRQTNVSLIAGVASGCVVLVFVISILAWRRNRRRVTVLKRANSKHSRQLQLTIDRLLDNWSSGMVSEEQDSSSGVPTHLPVLQLSQFDICAEPLGSGNFATVSQATVTRNKGKTVLMAGSTVAIKAFTAIEEHDIEAIQAVVLEACMLHTLRHKHIVPVLGVISDTLPLSIVMELAPQGSLKPLLQACDPPLDLAIKMEMMLQCASGLAYVHSNNVIHRDMAARNILVYSSEAPLVKLSDFGLGRRLNTTQDYYRSTSVDNMPFRWMAPESLSNGKFTYASDVWSFGIVMWETIHNGATPYANLTMPQIVRMQREGRRLPMSDKSHGQLSLILMKCWSIDPRQRPTMKAVVQMLQSQLEELAQVETSI